VAGDPDITYDYYHCGYQVVEVRKDSDVYEQVVWDGRYVHSPCLRWRDADENGQNVVQHTCTSDANFNVTTLISTARKDDLSSYGRSSPPAPPKESLANPCDQIVTMPGDRQPKLDATKRNYMETTNP